MKYQYSGHYQLFVGARFEFRDQVSGERKEVEVVRFTAFTCADGGCDSYVTYTLTGLDRETVRSVDSFGRALGSVRAVQQNFEDVQ